jgi:predicted ATPase
LVKQIQGQSMAQAASAKRASSVSSGDEAQLGITAITVQGYKSIDDEVTVSIAPLTILAGANSSGKSSLMQPLLLMKQTLEAPYDPGALMLNGPNLKFTSAEQLFTLRSSPKSVKHFNVGVEIQKKQKLKFTFEKHPEKLIDLALMSYQDTKHKFSFSQEMDHESLLQSFPNDLRNVYESYLKIEKSQEELKRINSTINKLIGVELGEVKNNLENFVNKAKDSMSLSISRNRCFFDIYLQNSFNIFESELSDSQESAAFLSKITEPFKELIQELIHVPGLRGNPERTYNTTAIGREFPGTFEHYVASVINYWQSLKDSRLKKLEIALNLVGLTSRIESKKIDDTQVELQVGRLPCIGGSKNTKKDMVSIADVGFGVSQTLPVIVALLTARPGQLVYIEQPEIHLHPRAQVAIAEIFADAANRGVRVVVETHSELFLMGVQSLVAEGKLAPDKVKLHWFTRQENGNTKITSADLDESGSFGEDWPEDFAEVSLSIQNRYLSAAEAKLWRS